jgi:hypothetical protein
VSDEEVRSLTLDGVRARRQTPYEIGIGPARLVGPQSPVGPHGYVCEAASPQRLPQPPHLRVIGSYEPPYAGASASITSGQTKQRLDPESYLIPSRRMILTMGGTSVP